MKRNLIITMALLALCGCALKPQETVRSGKANVELLCTIGDGVNLWRIQDGIEATVYVVTGGPAAIAVAQ